MDTSEEKENFEYNWSIFLNLIQKVSFDEIFMHKVYTYAFDLRPKLYEILEKNGFFKDAILKDHCFFNNNFIDVVIHSKINYKC